MKSLRATKVENGWYVEITRTIIISHKEDVFKLAQQEGLKVDKLTLQCRPDMIFAD